MVNTALLEDVIAKKGIKECFICEQLNISQQAWINKKKNEREFKASEIDKLTELLNITTYKAMKDIFFAANVE